MGLAGQTINTHTYTHAVLLLEMSLSPSLILSVIGRWNDEDEPVGDVDPSRSSLMM